MPSLSLIFPIYNERSAIDRTVAEVVRFAADRHVLIVPEIAIGGLLKLETAYSFDPLPAGLTPDQARHGVGDTKVVDLLSNLPKRTPWSTCNCSTI